MEQNTYISNKQDSDTKRHFTAMKYEDNLPKVQENIPA